MDRRKRGRQPLSDNPGRMAANQADFLGEGTYDVNDVLRPARTEEEIREEERKRVEANRLRGLDAYGNPLPAYGTPVSQGGTAQQYQVTNQQMGTQNVTRRATDPTGRPIYNAPPTSTVAGYTTTAGDFVPGADPAAQQPQRPLTANELAEVIDSSTTSYEDSVPDPTEQEPPEFDRTKVDELMGKVNQATSGLLGIAENEDQYSAAQAQLALGLAQAQRSNLSLARSGSRRDRSLRERQALMGNAEQAAEATRSAALLRAQEEESNRRLRMEAYKAAGDLGLNAGALEIEIGRLDMESVTSYLNQLFETKRLGMTLDQAEAERITEYIRDMALVAKDYYGMSLEERQAVRDDLTRRHGIDTQLEGILAQLDAEPGFWEKAGLGIISAGGQLGGALITKSDRRAKYQVTDASESELEELLAAVGAKTFKYKQPDRDGEGDNFGLMAQDLRKTKFGKSLTFDDQDGEISVDGGKAGLAALAGLAMVYDKLKELEEAL